MKRTMPLFLVKIKIKCQPQSTEKNSKTTTRKSKRRPKWKQNGETPQRKRNSYVCILTHTFRCTCCVTEVWQSEKARYINRCIVSLSKRSVCERICQTIMAANKKKLKFSNAANVMVFLSIYSTENYHHYNIEKENDIKFFLLWRQSNNVYASKICF